MSPDLGDAVRAYRRASPLLGDNPRANAAYLQETAAALTVSTAGFETAGIRPIYRTHIASVRRDDSVLTLTSHGYPATSVAFGTTPDGRLLLGSGSANGALQLRDRVTGRPVGEPLDGPGSGVTSVAFGTTPDGRLLLGSGSANGALQLGPGHGQAGG